MAMATTCLLSLSKPFFFSSSSSSSSSSFSLSSFSRCRKEGVRGQLWRGISVVARAEAESASPQENQPKATEAEMEKGKEKEKEKEKDVPSWALPDSDQPPPWERAASSANSSESFQIPFFVYLLASGIISIAAVGSVFEYFNQRPVFGIVYPGNPLYTPILGFFAITGLPTAVFLFLKSIAAANKAAEEQDKEDGFYN